MRSIVIFLAFIVSSCSGQVEIDNITDIPVVVDADHPFADVYSPLDGTWKGVFLVKEDSHPINKPSNLQDTALMSQFITSSKTIHTIHVTQTYTSESPYFQRVSISDFYPDTGKTERSTGVNKIQDGKMWCVVHKPNDKVIHSGSTPNDHTIIWQSNKPKRTEYFYESVGEHYYEIIGYGYYNDDDTSLSPKLWFYGKYERQ